MEIDPLLLEVLACPCEHHAPVELTGRPESFVCTRCATTFPVTGRHPGDAAGRGDPRPAEASAPTLSDEDRG